MFRIIRAGTKYCVVVVVTPADATPDSKEAKFFQRQDWSTDHRKANEFFEISRADVSCAFGGQADCWGFSERPKIDFASLADVESWILKNQEQEKL